MPGTATFKKKIYRALCKNALRHMYFKYWINEMKWNNLEMSLSKWCRKRQIFHFFFYLLFLNGFPLWKYIFFPDLTTSSYIAYNRAPLIFLPLAIFHGNFCFSKKNTSSIKKNYSKISKFLKYFIYVFQSFLMLIKVFQQIRKLLSVPK
jgi:hypothetical protein